MIAFIPAAGYGTRLGSLTAETPKALVPVLGTPMIVRLIQKLTTEGFTRYVINLHHFANQLEQFLRNQSFNVNLEFSCERQQLLDTGGAIIHAAEKLKTSEQFLVHNVDVILPVHTMEIYSAHKKAGAMVTVAVSDRNSSRKLLFDRNNYLCGWINEKTGEVKKAANYTSQHRALAYSGVQWTSRAYLDVETRTGKFSIIDSWLDLCATYPIIAFEHTSEGWFDLGVPENIRLAETYLQKRQL